MAEPTAAAGAAAGGTAAGASSERGWSGSAGVPAAPGEAREAGEAGESGESAARGGSADPAVSAVLTVRYFAAAAEVAGVESETLAVPEPAVLGALQNLLVERYGEPMQRILRSGSFLIGGIVRRDREHPLAGTVDVLPPFAGG